MNTTRLAALRAAWTELFGADGFGAAADRIDLDDLEGLSPESAAHAMACTEKQIKALRHEWSLPPGDAKIVELCDEALSGEGWAHARAVLHHDYIAVR